jgi:hypothetical protein
MTTHAIDPTTKAARCASYLYRSDQEDVWVTCRVCLRLLDEAESEDEAAEQVPPRAAFVNVGPEHMPLGLDDHLAHLQRLAARGERDES